jgi:hypothetical protein
MTSLKAGGTCDVHPSDRRPGRAAWLPRSRPSPDRRQRSRHRPRDPNHFHCRSCACARRSTLDGIGNRTYIVAMPEKNQRRKSGQAAMPSQRCVDARTGQTRTSHANIRSRLIRVHQLPDAPRALRASLLLDPASVLGCTSSGRQIWITPVYFANVITRDVSPPVMSTVLSVFWARLTRIR